MDEREYVFGHRQLAAVAFVMVGLLGSGAAVAYMVGRAVTPSPVSASDEHAAAKMVALDTTSGRPSPSAKSADPLPIPVTATEPVKTVAPKVPPPAPTASETKPPTAAAAPPAPASPQAPASEFAKGSQYFQVVATDRPHANAVVAKLKAAGAPAVIGEGPSPDRVRVFAGPVDAASQKDIRAIVEQQGFKPFLKKF